MVKYIDIMLQASRLIGTAKTIEMKEANKFLPARIEITGITDGGEKFELELTVGERKNDS